MTAEGVFPKVAGDLIYASEVNKFITVLGHGSATIIGNNTRQEVGHFTRNEAQGDSCMVVEYTYDGASAHQGFCLGITPTSSTITCSNAYQLPLNNKPDGFIKVRIIQYTTDAGNVGIYVIYFQDGDDGVYNSTTQFTEGGTDTFYLNVNTATGSTCRVRWIAYLIRG